MTDFEFIQKFSKISVNKICENLGIDRGNVARGSTTEENLHKIRKAIESEIAKLYIEV